MSGHSKWSSIKHKKAITDARRGKIFSHIVKEVSIAARIGGGDPDTNPRLRLAIEKAKGCNMPHDNIKKAIMKGTGELPGATYEEATYEGYGPGGVAILLETLTDNKNRTVSELRNLLSKNNGNLGETGCVAWLFEKRGYILVDKSTDEDTLMSIVIEAGALDMKNEPDEVNYEIITDPKDIEAITDEIRKAGVSIVMSEVSMLPKNYVNLTGKAAGQMTRLMDALDEHEDVRNVYANFNIPDEMISKETGSR
jgi:YebC/PmpR family DNA-binding regulatory protein